MPKSKKRSKPSPRAKTSEVFDLHTEADHPMVCLTERSPVFRLFIDVIELARLAGQQTASAAARAAAARSSILTASTIPEAVANVMRRYNHTLARAGITIAHRQAPDLLKYLKEKLRADADARARQIGELIRLRNGRLAHGMTRPLVMDRRGTTYSAYEPEPGLLPALGISPDEEKWKHEDAITVIRAVADFLNYFFLEVCSCWDRPILNFFGTNQWFKNNGQVWPEARIDKNKYRVPSIQYAVKTWGIDLRFLDRATPHNAAVRSPALTVSAPMTYPRTIAGGDSTQ